MLAIMAQLRNPDHGCPWDLEQNFASIAPHTIEEAYEVADAIERGDLEGLRDELGDLLLQVVFHAQMAKEEGLFDFEAVAQQLIEKLLRRHPHVFGADATTAATEVANSAEEAAGTTAADASDAAGVTASWEAIKAAERRRKGSGDSALDDVATALPALMRAGKLQRRAARVGFDWPDYRGTLEKIYEELNEVKAELPTADPQRLEDEIGDVLFAVTNLSRHLGVDSETALRRAGQRFEQRFRAVEAEFRQHNTPLKGQPIEVLEAAWQRAKKTVS
nr:nucleoside triphosphate pyrophosphohydrolase [Halorhodospira abdelmalekii]